MRCVYHFLSRCRTVLTFELLVQGPSPPSSPRVVPYPWTRPGRKPLPSWVYDLPEVPLVDCKLRPAIWVDEESDDEEEIAEELGYISPLDTVNPYVTFKHALTSE